MKILRYAALSVLGLLFVSPLLFMISTSFKSRVESSRTPPTWLPEDPTFAAYQRILDAADTPVFRWFLNSMLAASANAFLVVATAALAAYALARMEFRGRKAVFALIIATLFVPPVILVIPNYEIVGRLYWLDTLTAVIVPTAANAFGVFFLRQFFLALPKELEESAALDGANVWHTFWRIVLPLSTPGLVTVGVLAFVGSWNAYLLPLLLLQADMRTLPLGVADYSTEHSADTAGVLAFTSIAMIPALVLFLALQRRIVSGLQGAVKG